MRLYLHEKASGAPRRDCVGSSDKGDSSNDEKIKTYEDLSDNKKAKDSNYKGR